MKTKMLTRIMLTLLLAGAFIWAFNVQTVKAEFTTKASDEGSSSTPTVSVMDFQNGTTLTIIDYPNGTQDVISETMLVKTAKLQLELSTVNQSMSAAIPTSTDEATDYVTTTQDAVFEQEVLLGFTWRFVAYRKILDLDIVVAYVRAGYDVDIGLGLRLPVRITLEYPEQMTVEHDYELYATLNPLDLPDYDEFLCRFRAQLWVEAGVWIPIVGWVEYSASFGPNYDWSRSFATPLGPAMEFPIPSFEITVVDYWLLKVKVVVDPQLGSDEITAKASAGGDADGEHTLTWSAPDQRIPFTVHASDYGPTDFAEIQLSDFRYYFSLFLLHFKLKFDFHDWIDWLTGDPTIGLFTLDMSWLTEGLYLGVHQGTDGTVDVSVFVKKFGVDILVTPVSQDITPGDMGTYNVLVINRGNILDTFALSLTSLPGSWWYEFSSVEVEVDAYASTSVQLSVQPHRHWSTAPGDYPFTLTGESQQAPLHDLVADDSESGLVHVLPFYEVSISITPAIVSLYPSDTAVYSIVVINLGNVPDTFDIFSTYIDFDGAYRVDPTCIQSAWATIDKTSVALNPGVSDIITLSIMVPSDWRGIEDATYDFIETATSKTDGTASDSDSGQLTVQATKESMIRYINLELEWLTNEVATSGIDDDIRLSLLDKLANATKKKEQALEYILASKEKLANKMLTACIRMTSAFINEVDAQVSEQPGKHIPDALGETWISRAEQIITDLDTAILTSI